MTLGKCELIQDSCSTCSTADSLSMFNKAAFVAAFEKRLQLVMQTFNVGYPVYLCLGEEFISAAVATVYDNMSLFAQHRCHGWYLSLGGEPEKLRDEILGLPSGYCGGMAGSPSVCNTRIGMFGHSGLLGDQIPIAVGAAIGGMKNVVSVAGDAAVEEDYALAAYGFAASRKLPILFICEDNGLSILTKTEIRRKWNICDVVRGFGMTVYDIVDDPWLIMHYIKNNELPLFLNIKTCRKLWHSGCGSDGEPTWDRYSLVRNEMVKMGLATQVIDIEKTASDAVEKIWQEQLQKQ